MATSSTTISLAGVATATRDENRGRRRRRESERRLREARRERTGERIGDYELLTCLGAGGMAAVHLACDDDDAFFAVKLPHPELLEDESAIRMLVDEARIARHISHPHVLGAVEALRTSDGGVALVMDYVEGESLSVLLKSAQHAGARISLPIALRVGLDALAALDAAHELTDDEGRRLNLVHRDVTPSNLLVGCDGKTRLMDFGIARFESRLTLTRPGFLKGKLGYIAPEQARGGEVSARTDLFALGLSLWEMVAGGRPFEGSGFRLLKRMLKEPFPSICTRRAGLEPLQRVFDVVLARDPAARFDSAAEMASALVDIADELGGIATQEEVAEWVESTGQRTLLRRRGRVLSALRRRAETPRVDDPSPTLVDSRSGLFSCLGGDDELDADTPSEEELTVDAPPTPMEVALRLLEPMRRKLETREPTGAAAVVGAVLALYLLAMLLLRASG